MSNCDLGEKSSSETGTGLRIMRQRANMLGGVLTSKRHSA